METISNKLLEINGWVAPSVAKFFLPGEQDKIFSHIF